MTGGFRVGISLLFVFVMTRATPAVVQAPPPSARFRAETAVDRLLLDWSVNDLDGEQDYRDNMSGCCVMPSTGELLIIINRSDDFSKPPAIQVYDRDGTYLRHIPLNGFSDTEGICQYDPDNDEFAIVDEAVNDITIVTITSATTNIIKSLGRTIDTGIPVGEDGLEGVTYDRRNGIFYAIREIPMGVFRVTTNGGSVVSEELFDAGAVFSGICTDLSDVFYDARSGHLLILSDEGKLLMECELDGTILGMRPITATQPEGLTVADSGAEVYVCGEPNEYYRFTLEDPGGDVAEGSTAELLVELSEPSTGSVSVGYSISSDSAVPGQDFGPPSAGTLTFDPGCICQTVTVDVLNDTAVEGVEELRVALTNAVNAQLGVDSAYDLSIVNGAAGVPTLDLLPFDCEVTPDTTPAFSFQSDDPDGAAGIVYEVRWSQDPEFATGVTVRNSSADAGFESTANGADVSPFEEGQQIRFTVQPGDALTDTPDGTVYHWQARASDAATELGSGTFGDWSASRSLGVDSGLALPQWRQTAGEQFGSDDLNGAVVSDANSVYLEHAVIGFDKAASGKAEPADTIVIHNFAVANRSNRLLVLGVATLDGATVASATFAGLPLTRLDYAQQGSRIGAHLWYLKNPPVTVGQVVVSLSGLSIAVAGVTSWYNVSQDSTFGSVAKAAGVGRSSSLEVAAGPGTVVIDTMAIRAPKDILAGPGQTRRWANYSYVWGWPPWVVVTGLSSKPANAPVTMSWSWADDQDSDWALVGVPLQPAATSMGTVTSPAIDFDWLPPMARWNELTFTDDESAGTVTYDVQRWEGGGWHDTVLTNLDTSPVDISRLDPVVHNRIRLRATLARGSDTPHLLDWAVSWAPASTCSVHAVSEHDGISPAGALTVPVGDAVTLAVTNSPVAHGARTQYVGTGWSQTGCMPLSGVGTNTGAFAATNHTRLTWQWQPEYWLSVTTRGHGATTGGNAWVAHGAGVELTATPDQYYLFDAWTGDLGGQSGNPAVLTSTVERAQSVVANFSADMATNSTPKWWLADYYGHTNDFNSVALSDTDGDGMLAWQEYGAGTDPTDSASLLQLVLTALGQDGFRIFWSSVTGRRYSVYQSTNILAPWPHFPLTNGITGDESGTNVFTIPLSAKPGVFYRIEVDRP